MRQFSGNAACIDLYCPTTHGPACGHAMIASDIAGALPRPTDAVNGCAESQDKPT